MSPTATDSTLTLIEAQLAFHEAQAEMDFRHTQLMDITSYARLADMPTNLLAVAACRDALEAATAEYRRCKRALLAVVGVVTR